MTASVIQWSEFLATELSCIMFPVRYKLATELSCIVFPVRYELATELRSIVFPVKYELNLYMLCRRK
jgi:hypothetical protein